MGNFKANLIICACCFTCSCRWLLLFSVLLLRSTALLLLLLSHFFLEQPGVLLAVVVNYASDIEVELCSFVYFCLGFLKTLHHSVHRHLVTLIHYQGRLRSVRNDEPQEVLDAQERNEQDTENHYFVVGDRVWRVGDQSCFIEIIYFVRLLLIFIIRNKWI